MTIEKLNYDLLKQVKKGFVQQPGADPNAGMGGMPPGGAPMGGDPMAGGMPMGGDPMAGGMPMGGDPMAGGMPPPGLDAAMAGLVGGGAPGGEAPAGPSQITISIDELIKLINMVNKGSGGAPANAAPAPAGADTSELATQVSELVNMLKQ